MLNQRSVQLMKCIATLIRNDEHGTPNGIDIKAKMQLEAKLAEIMPKGMPNYQMVREMPAISQLIAKFGIVDMHKVMFCLVYDFCNSVNVVRNMNEAQMTEAAGFILNECGNFRLEDYVMMFALAKRGKLVKIMDRIDIQVIGQILDAYWVMRDEAGKRLQEQEYQQFDNSIDRKDVTFAPVLSDAMTRWLKELPDEEEKPIDKKQVEAYARLHNVNMEEILKQFGKDGK